MYSYEWDPETGGFLLTPRSSAFVANELRPVFAKELDVTGLKERFDFDPEETRPLMWAKKNLYFVDGAKVAQLNNVRYGAEPEAQFDFPEEKKRLRPVDVKRFVEKNAEMASQIVADAKKRIKELFDRDAERRDVAYIAFSGGKDSVALLDLCDDVLPLSVPVVYSDTGMELPSSLEIWRSIQERYPRREFVRAEADRPALEDWRRFGPPSRTIRWCCAVRKSAPAIMALKERLKKPAIQTMAFVGVRKGESLARSSYEDDFGDGVKCASQFNRMPILDWGAHELWLYTFANDLPINDAYRWGLPRVGCAMCPEASEKYEWFVAKAYPKILEPYQKVIVETSIKKFKNEGEAIEFIGGSNWQARKSGAVLRETIAPPVERIDNLACSFQDPNFSPDSFWEWIKTLGRVTRDPGTGATLLELPRGKGGAIPFEFSEIPGGGARATFRFESAEERLRTLPLVKGLLRKARACVNCRACEAECVLGAISSRDGRVKIDADKCVKCRRCYDTTGGSCWRYKSMNVPVKSSATEVKINNYVNFGLREKGQSLWISTLIEMGENFFPWHAEHPLGRKMVESARSWFIQSGLITEGDRKPTLLLDLFKRYGGDSPLGWDFLWASLVNRSDLVKWFVSQCAIGAPRSVDELRQTLSETYPSLGASSIDGGLAALKDMLTKSPLGAEGAVARVETKGNKVLSITRRAKDVDSLTLLYSLYLIAEITGRREFSVHEMLDVGDYISPIVAFGISPETFKRQCGGLYTKYPRLLSTTFTHGNDGFALFPDQFNSTDVVRLALEK